MRQHQLANPALPMGGAGLTVERKYWPIPNRNNMFLKSLAAVKKLLESCNAFNTFICHGKSEPQYHRGCKTPQRESSTATRENIANITWIPPVCGKSEILTN